MPTANAPWFTGPSPDDRVFTPESYRSAGCLLVELADPDYPIQYEYDEQGRLLRMVVNGRPYTMEHDDCGRVVAEFEEGSSNPIDVYTYTSAGQLQTHLHDDGAWSSYRLTYEWDDAGHLVRTFHDYDLEELQDGWAEDFEYDEAGNLIRQVTPDWVKTWTYDDAGRLVSAGQDGLPPLSGGVGGITPDGYPEYRAAWTYDDQGRLATYSWEDDVLGDATWTDAVGRGTATFTWRADGLLDAYEVDTANDGLVDRRSTFRHPVPGVARIEEQDRDADGVVDATDTLTVDPVTHIISVVTEGDWERRWVLHHDCSIGTD